MYTFFSYLKYKVFTSGFWCKVFNRQNFTKVIVIFIVGLVSRIVIWHFLNVNVFSQYDNYISLLYYSIMSFFIVLINELIAFFHLSVIPIAVIDFFVYLHKSIIKFLCLLLKGFLIGKHLCFTYINNHVFFVRGGFK